jgi:RNA polymerase sigma-70 factor (ECF subfamily)
MHAPAAAPAPGPTALRDARHAGWLQAAAAGDTRAFEQFHDESLGCALALARRMVPAGEVDDVVAEACFDAWRRAARFDATRGSAVTWLLQIVRSRALDVLRARAAEPRSAAEAPEAAGDPRDDPAERLWQLQAGTRLHAALQQLAPPERWVLGLAYFKGLTQGEIATATGLPLGTVKSHAQRAQTKLKAALAGSV